MNLSSDFLRFMSISPLIFHLAKFYFYVIIMDEGMELINFHIISEENSFIKRFYSGGNVMLNQPTRKFRDDTNLHENKYTSDKKHNPSSKLEFRPNSKTFQHRQTTIKNNCAVIISPKTLYCEALAHCLNDEFERMYGVYDTITDFVSNYHLDEMRGVILIILDSYFINTNEDIEIAINDMIEPSIITIGSEQQTNHLFGIQDKIRGIIPLNSSLILALQAIRLVQYGGSFLPRSDSLNKNNSSSGDNTSSKNCIELTRTQVSIAEALRTGKSNKLIAHSLDMNEHTVKVHIRNILKRLGARNRTEAALLISRTRHSIYDPRLS